MKLSKPGQRPGSRTSSTFDVPARRWWEDVGYTRSTILLFRSEGDLTTWCNRRGLHAGGMLTLDVSWRLACEWYHDRLEPSWQRKTLDEAQRLLARPGMLSDFWQP